MLGTGGTVASKADALKRTLKQNAQDQTKVNDRATAVEARLRKTYSALDAKMATLSSLSSYVTAQLAQWNKSTN